MTVVQINSVCGSGSTGRIVVGISEALCHEGIENYILYTEGSSNYPNAIKCGNRFYTKYQALLSRVTGLYGFVSTLQTHRIISQLKRLKPDTVHIHNIHGHDCNIEILFAYLKKNNIKVVFTLHDCWLLTGYCTYFTAAKCNKWMTGCHHCPQYRKASFFFDKSRELYERKKQAFTGLDATVVTPSKWLADIAKQSFLKQFPIRVINNGIDLNIFQPTPSTLREKYQCQGKYVLLGVAAEWGHRKGLDVFVQLAKDLGDEYQIILVGTSSKTDKLFPHNIISIHRTDNPKQMAELYSMADLFVNPTREENFPTVNIESLACGTPVITYRTGGSPEMITPICGCIVEYENYGNLISTITSIKEKALFKQEKCITRAADFAMGDKYAEYVNLYQTLHR